MRGSPSTEQPVGRQPIFNVPGAILAMLAVLVAVHAGRSLLADDLDDWLTLALAFIPARYSGAADQLPGGTLAALFSPLTHMLLHGDWAHLGLNAAWLLVFGTIVARRLGQARSVLFTIVTGVVGALAFLVFNWGAVLPMVGASGAISGLMGGAIRLLHAVMRVGAMRDIGVAANFVPLPGVRETLRDRQVLIIVGVTLATNLALGASGSLLTPGSAGIAWEAHLGGFAVGLLAFGVFDPGPRPLPPNPQVSEPHSEETPAARGPTGRNGA